MKILFMGDIVGKSGREIVLDQVPKLRQKLSLDFVIANGENAAHGFGLTPKLFNELTDAGVNAITLGNHTFDKKEIYELLQNEPRLVRPFNYPEGTIGNGLQVYTLPDGRKIVVIQVLGKLFMPTEMSPFEALDAALGKLSLGQNVQAIVVDIHGEATSEKMAMGFYGDGRVSLVAGTHTHVPTADAMTLPSGSGYITDIGMCGDYWSVIGMTPETALSRFLDSPSKTRLAPAEKDGTLCAVYIETNDDSGLCKDIRSICIGAHLKNLTE